MIKINKRPLPSGVTITNEKDYRSGVVFQMLIEDCNKKCYICEDSVHTSPNVEHRVSHKDDPALKYDWNNLLLSCGHCNNTKLDKYDGIIDPTQINPEEFQTNPSNESKSAIKSELSDKSLFAAFKRKMVSDNCYYTNEYFGG